MKQSKKQVQFEESRKDMTDREIQMEILYASWLIQNRTERTRANTSVIKWIMVIGVLLSIIGFFALGLRG